VVIPPGVDVSRFTPMSDDARRAVRSRYGIDPDAQLVLGLSRLVPRKGFDTLIEASARLRWNHPKLVLAIAGKGRDRERLEEMAKAHDAPVLFLGRVPDEDLGAIHGAADVFAMLCRNRWGGLEQEGYGIVFVEAAAAGVPSIAGLSGGSHEAVVDGVTGVVVQQPEDIEQVAEAMRRLLDDPGLRDTMGRAARVRAEHELSYDVLAARLWAALQALA
jgi:phosphatidylinositol alpha-1,6-mannosyltransferase